jgi:transketolase
MEETKIREAKKFAVRIRIAVMKQLIQRGFGHIGGCFSCAELFAVLYSGVMRIDPERPLMEERDRLIISKGHAGPAGYAALALKGYFPMDWLLTLNEGGTRLPSHCDRKKTPGIDFSTGSLGQGLSAGAGIAYAYALDKKENDIYVLLGDGELQEGQIWEAVMAANKFALGHLYCFVDANKIQLDGTTDEIMPLLSIAGKFQAFGWHTQEVNGHDVASLYAAIDIARGIQNRPCVIIMNTVKGYGAEEISSLKHLSHHMHISKEQGERIVSALEKQLNAL